MTKIICNFNKIFFKSQFSNSRNIPICTLFFNCANSTLKTIDTCKKRYFRYLLDSRAKKYEENTKKSNFLRLMMAVSFAQIYEFIGTKNEFNTETRKLMSKAEEVLENGNPEEATKLYSQALQTAQKSMDLENLYLIKEHLGMIAFSLQKYKDAEVLLREVEDHLAEQKTKEADVLRMSHVILRLAEIYENLNNFEKAEQYYNACADKMKFKLDDAVHIKNENFIELWLMFLASEAHYYLHRGNYDKAHKYFKKAYEISLETKGEISEHTVTFLHQLGAVCFQKGDLEVAIDYLEKASELGKHLPSMVHLSNVYVTLGNIYLKQGFIVDAERLCTQAYKNAVRHKYEKGIEESDACLKELKEAVSYNNLV